MQIRMATVADADGIARVHVDSWRTTYRGIVPDEYLQQLSYERRRPVWEQILQGVHGEQHVFVAEHSEQGIVGFAACGRERSARSDYDGELYAIYLRAEAQGMGVGRQLFERVLTQLHTIGCQSMLVWVLADNPSRTFYEHMGGRFVTSRIEEIGGKALEELAYGWNLTE